MRKIDWYSTTKPYILVLELRRAVTSSREREVWVVLVGLFFLFVVLAATLAPNERTQYTKWWQPFLVGVGIGIVPIVLLLLFIRNKMTVYAEHVDAIQKQKMDALVVQSNGYLEQIEAAQAEFEALKRHYRRRRDGELPSKLVESMLRKRVKEMKDDKKFEELLDRMGGGAEERRIKEEFEQKKAKIDAELEKTLEEIENQDAPEVEEKVGPDREEINKQRERYQKQIDALTRERKKKLEKLQKTREEAQAALKRAEDAVKEHRDAQKRKKQARKNKADQEARARYKKDWAEWKRKKDEHDAAEAKKKPTTTRRMSVHYRGGDSMRKRAGDYFALDTGTVGEKGLDKQWKAAMESAYGTLGMSEAPGRPKSLADWERLDDKAKGAATDYVREHVSTMPSSERSRRVKVPPKRVPFTEEEPMLYKYMASRRDDGDDDNDSPPYSPEDIKKLRQQSKEAADAAQEANKKGLPDLNKLKKAHDEKMEELMKQKTTEKRTLAGKELRDHKEKQKQKAREKAKREKKIAEDERSTKLAQAKQKAAEAKAKRVKQREAVEAKKKNKDKQEQAVAIGN